MGQLCEYYCIFYILHNKEGKVKKPPSTRPFPRSVRRRPRPQPGQRLPEERLALARPSEPVEPRLRVGGAPGLLGGIAPRQGAPGQGGERCDGLNLEVVMPLHYIILAL